MSRNPIDFLDRPNTREQFYADHGVTVPDVLTATDVPCAHCSAKRGERCRISHDLPLDVVAHAPRVEAWLRRHPKFRPERDAYVAARAEFVRALSGLPFPHAPTKE